jgi:hypothetical protein
VKRCDSARDCADIDLSDCAPLGRCVRHAPDARKPAQPARASRVHFRLAQRLPFNRKPKAMELVPSHDGALVHPGRRPLRPLRFTHFWSNSLADYPQLLLECALFPVPGKFVGNRGTSINAVLKRKGFRGCSIRIAQTNHLRRHRKGSQVYMSRRVLHRGSTTRLQSESS